MSLYARLRKLASETAIYGISSILGRMINFLLFPFYSNVFPPDLYGVVTVVYAAFVFLNIVYQYGMESAYLKFASDTEETAVAGTVFSTATWSLLGTSVGLSLLMVLFREPVGTVIGLDVNWLWLLYYAAIILVLDALAIIPFADLRLKNRPWRFAAIRLVNIGVNVGMNLVLILRMDMGIEAIFIANMTASAVSLLLLLPTYVGALRFSFDGNLWKTLLRFGLPFVPGGLGYAITERVNIFFLKRMSPERVLELYGDQIDVAALAARAEGQMLAFQQQAPDPSHPDVLRQAAEVAEAVYGQYVVGVYGGVIKLAVFMTLVVQMFRFAWQPFFLQHARDADARVLFARVFTLFTAVCLFVLLAIAFFVQELVAFPLPGGYQLVQQKYWLGLFVVPVALLAYLFQGWYYNFSAGFYIEKQTRYFIHCTVLGSAITLVMNVTLVPHYGMLAAVWATLAAYLAMAVALLLFARRVYPVPYEWGRVLGMGALAAGLFAAWSQIPAFQTGWVELLLLAVFLGGLVPLRIVPLQSLRKLWPGRK